MCGRYGLYDDEELIERFKPNTGYEFKPNYNVAPSQTMPVVTIDGIEMMRWGLIPKWAQDEKIGYKLINARSETVYEKPIWKSVMKNRCLIPANGFYEWQKHEGGKQPFFIHPKDQVLFFFAGIWETWKREDNVWRTYSILTTEPNKEMLSIHDRMPLILHKDDETQWLQADTQNDVEALMRPLEDGALELYEVSTSVNTVKINDESLIGPINSK